MLSPTPIKYPLKALQYKILNSILNTNKKLLQIRYCEHDGCTFCDKESETLHHPFFLFPSLEYLLETSRKLLFRNNKQSYGSQPSKYHYRYYNLLLNYLILIEKIHIWDCRRTHAHPNIESFKLKVKIYYQTEINIASTNNDLETFYKN